MQAHRVVIVGGGFAGLCAARGLGGSDAQVTLIDRRNHHLFQPLLYQVATGALSPANIAAPLRALVKRHSNVSVRLGEVLSIDMASRQLTLADGSVPFDTLIVAAGSNTSYFGHDEWQSLAGGLKTVEDARNLRHRILSAFEQAELCSDPDERRRLLTFVVVGGGPTGVELAGAIAEVSRGTLPGEFRKIDPATARVILIEGADRILGAFSPPLPEKAQKSLEHLGVEVWTGATVQTITQDGVRVDRQGTATEIAAETTIWAAGVKASALGKSIAASCQIETDRGGRVPVEADCTVAGFPELFVIGDLASFQHGTERPLPGLAPVAMQQGRYAARVVLARLAGREVAPFRYNDKGAMATIGRKLAVAETGRLRFSGFLAWLAWLFIHLMYLAEFQNRLLVLAQWGWSYVTRNRSARLITERQDERQAKQPVANEESQL